MAFRGTFDYTLDAKNRVTIPTRFRATLAEGLVLAPGLERCVAIWQPEAYDEHIAGAVAGLNPLSPQAIKIKRELNGRSFETELDAAGRVMVPPPLLEYGGLGKDVAVLGAGDFIELWDRDARAAVERDPENAPSSLTASLGTVA